ncbi:hypothetical protein ACWCQW_51540 [Streptomyces mirabilis]
MATSRVREVPPADIQDAQIIVGAVDIADASTLELVRELNDNTDARSVMVMGQRWQADIAAAVDRGVRAVLWRDAFTPATFIRTLLTIPEGGGSFPPTLQGTLMEQVLEMWSHRRMPGTLPQRLHHQNPTRHRRAILTFDSSAQIMPARMA